MTDRRHRYRPQWRRWLGYFFIMGLAVICGLGVGIYGLARLSVPDYDGQTSLGGLEATVTIHRDRFGVPRIEAETMDDAYRALGYIHAQDRLFQMEMNRRAGAGRLAEIIGAPVLPIDQLMRTLGLYRMAEEIVATLPPETAAALDAYAQGVNAWIAADARRRLPEFIVLRIEPEPWHPADSVVWGLLMALQLSSNWRTELQRASLADQLTADQLDDLWPPVDPDRSITLASATAGDCCLSPQSYAALAQAVPGLIAGPNGSRSIADTLFAFASASNEWALAGAHTASGKPLLANDPHLGYSAPILWYLAEIKTPELELTGATVPGMPFTLLGHNGHIAWGFTTTHADTQDLFVERVDPADPTRYLKPGGSDPFEVRREEITVRGRDKPEILIIRTTRHGPVISDIIPDAAAAATQYDIEGDQVIALAFSALTMPNLTTAALFRLNRARDWRAFTAALEDFHSPLQNIAYADLDGHIGLYTPGRLPIRAAGNGMQPVPGWTGEFDWQGFVPFAQMPHVFDPPGGRIVNANNRIVGDTYPYLVAADWPDSDRADRINDLLDALPEGRAQVADFSAMQMDIISPVARDLGGRMAKLAAIAYGTRPEPPAANDDGRGNAPNGEAALALLAAWDWRMDRNGAAPLIFTAWLVALGPRLYGDELGEHATTFGGIRPRTITTMLAERTQWCDDINTPAHENCAEIVRAALDEALATLGASRGQDMAAWRWGDVHKARFSHQLFGQVPFLRDLVDIEIENDGGDFTINRGSFVPGAGRNLFTNIHGPGYRAVYDLADLSNSAMTIATGQSGHPLSRHFSDLVAEWRDGRYLVLGHRGSDQGFPATTMVLRPAP